jgi:hypothetical protein
MCQELPFMQMVLALGHFEFHIAIQRLSELLMELNHLLLLLKLRWRAAKSINQ